MVTIEIFEMPDHSWDFRFVGGNNKKFGHDYNTPVGAWDSVQSLVEQLKIGEYQIIVRGAEVDSDN
jgi:hypothetical protein